PCALASYLTRRARLPSVAQAGARPLPPRPCPALGSPPYPGRAAGRGGLRGHVGHGGEGVIRAGHAVLLGVAHRRPARDARGGGEGVLRPGLAALPGDGAVAAQLPTRKVTFARKHLPDWKVGPRYELVRKLGSGSYGCVCEARDRERGRRVAIKRTRDVFGDLVTCRRTAREVCILAMLQRHENIVQLFDVVAPIGEDGLFDEVCLVMEVCDSDLGLLLRKDVELSPHQVRKILYTLLVGLKYLHSGGIWHRDLKPHNCLLNDDWTVKICDFGLARAAGGPRPRAPAEAISAEGAERLPNPRHAKAHRELTSHVCTRWYRAPEVILLQADYTAALDLWSVGCIFGELLGMLGSGRARERRGPLFPGDCCYPLSRDNDSSQSCRKAAARDQLEMIFATIGTPAVDELDKLDHAARRYVQKFGCRKGHGLQAKVPEADPAALEVLEATLRFGAARRASASGLLEHGIFAEVRRRATETRL
ncbi:unnamed protein product, partial [Prorocentrum cordatum]